MKQYEKGRQCTYNVILWCVRVIIIVTETQQCVSLYCWHTCSWQQNKTRWALPRKHKNGFTFHCCRAKQNISYGCQQYESKLLFHCKMSDFNQIWRSTDFRKSRRYQISWKSVQWEPSRWMPTDGRPDTKKLTDTFHYLCERLEGSGSWRSDTLFQFPRCRSYYCSELQ